MTNIQIQNFNTTIEKVNCKGIKPNLSIDKDQLNDMNYMMSLLAQYQLERSDSITIKDFISHDQKLVFSPTVVEAAQIMIATSMFKTFYEKGLLTEDEYLVFAREGEKRWRNMLSGDSINTKRVV